MCINYDDKKKKREGSCVSPLASAIDTTLSSSRNYRIHNSKQIKREVIQDLSMLLAPDPNYNISDEII
jgi:hypothetical protein